jgi:hypothetical protein
LSGDENRSVDSGAARRIALRMFCAVHNSPAGCDQNRQPAPQRNSEPSRTAI